MILLLQKIKKNLFKINRIKYKGKKLVVVSVKALIAVKITIPVKTSREKETTLTIIIMTHLLVTIGILNMPNLAIGDFTLYFSQNHNKI